MPETSVSWLRGSRRASAVNRPSGLTSITFGHAAISPASEGIALPGAHGNGVEQSRARDIPVYQLLQSDAEGEQRHQRRYADGNPQRRE
jgi:hypothetical protein